MECLHRGGLNFTDIGRIFLAVYGGGDIPTGSCIRGHFTHIRKKLESAGIDITIEPSGVRGGGMKSYRLRY